jgi:hypothetical protein
MMREEHAAKRMLAQEQKLRLATQTVANAANPQPAAAPLRPVAARAAPPAPAPAKSAPPPSLDAIAKAEAFAQAHVVAAAQIRHDRGVTPQNKARFRPLALPTDPMVIDALVHSSSDVLALLDEIGGEAMDAAA